MRALLSIFLFIPSVSLALPTGFIHPLEFDGSDAQKDKVISYIESSVRQQFCKYSDCKPDTLKMMEENDLYMFKKLTGSKNRTALDSVINEVCYSVTSRDCRYGDIEIMYRKYETPSTEKLTW